MNIELRTIKAMVKEWRKRIKQEIIEASNDRDAEAQEGNESEFECTKYYIKGLEYALREGKIIGEENE